MSLSQDIKLTKDEKNRLSKIKTDITSKNLLEIYNQLKSYSKKISYVNNNKGLICELINLSIEFLLKSDNYPDVFDAYCSFNFMNEYLILSNYNIYLINLQIIKSLGFLLVNLTNQAKIFYILSGNLINTIISKDYSSYDEEFFSFYVNFLKSITLRIDQNTIKLFYRETYDSFPLIDSTIKIYNHKDSMVRNVVRNIIINILKIKYDKIEEHFCQLPSASYFPNLCCRLRDVCIKFQEEINKNGKYDDYFDDIIEDLYFIDDIFNMGLEKINFILLNSLFYYFILPSLCGSLDGKKHSKLDINVSLFLIIVLFKNIKYETFRNCLFSLIFFDKLNKDILDLLVQPNELPYYCFEMVNQKETFCDLLSQNYKIKFIESLIQEENIYYLGYKDKYPELGNIIQKYKQFKMNKNEIDEEEKLEKIESIIISIINKNAYQEMTNYHKLICFGTGVKLGLYSIIENIQIFNICFICLIEKLFEDIKNENENNNKIKESRYFSNPIKEGLIYLLSGDNDDIILLINILIYICQNSNISETLLNKAKLENIYEKKDKILKDSKQLSISKRYSEEYSLFFSNNNFNFNNEYFELNNELKQNLDFKLINKIIHLFYIINPPLRKITFRLIIKNLKNLILENNNIKKINLPKNIYNSLIEIQNNIINKIQNFLYKGDIFLDNCYSNFIQERDYYCNDDINNLKKDIESIISNPKILLKENNDKNSILFQNKNQKTLIFKDLISFYIYMHDLNVILFDNIMNISDNKLIKDKNPLLNQNIYEFELDKNYDISKIINQKENNSIILEIVRIKTIDLLFYDKYSLIIYYPYIYFGTTDIKDVLIKYKYKITDLGIYKTKKGNNQEDNSLNFIIINQNENNGKNIDISIKFKNKESCDKIFFELFNGIDKIKKEEKETFQQYLENEKKYLFNEQK